MLVHPIEPTYNKDSEILILGSFPSVQSREVGFYYGHPKNRFWKVLAEVFEENYPETREDKRAFLIRNRIAVWDVIASCEIKGSADSTIENVKVNDLDPIFAVSNIQRVYVNGRKAHSLYQKHLEEKTGRKAIYLPSTSPANAAWGMDRLVEAWKVIRG